MIRTRQQLIDALRTSGGTVFGTMNGRPANPFRYELNGEIVHGNAISAALKHDELKETRRYWSHCAYRLKL